MVGWFLAGLSFSEKERLFYKFIFERKGAMGSEILELLDRELASVSLKATLLLLVLK